MECENMSLEKNIEIRLIIEPSDELYAKFIQLKHQFGLRSNSETARMAMKFGTDSITMSKKEASV
jgi:hypothetical protein